MLPKLMMMINLGTFLFFFVSFLLVSPKHIPNVFCVTVIFKILFDAHIIVSSISVL